MINVIFHKEVNLSKITFGEVETILPDDYIPYEDDPCFISKQKVKLLPLYYENEPFYIQTPKLFTPTGFQNIDEEDFSIDSFDFIETHKINLSLADSNNILGTFYSLLNLLDDKMISEIHQNVKMNQTNVYRRSIIYNNCINYSPSFNLKLNSSKPRNDLCNIQLYDHHRNDLCSIGLYDRNEDLASSYDTKKQCCIKEITPGTNISAIVICEGIWIIDGECGLSFKVTQLRKNEINNIFLG
jgi:hypothetical protein